MRGRSRTFLWFASAAVLLAAVLLLWPEDRGPSYERKHLSEWLAACSVDDDPDPESLLAVDAVRKIGTNGLPFLLNCLNYENPAWKQKIRASVNKTFWARPRVGYAILRLLADSADERADLAMDAFAVLGEKATPAIPALTNLLKHRERWDTSLRALRALSYIGTNGLAIVAAVVTNTSYPDTHRFVALDTIANAGTNATCAIPALIELLADEDMGPQTAVTLGRLKLQPTLVVPALAKCLHSENLLLPESAAEALAEYGPQAAGAVPDLLVAVANPEVALRIAATNALCAIAPEIYGRAQH